MIDLSAELARARQAAGLTQEQLAERLGVSRVQVSRIESGQRGTSYAMIASWFDACGYDLVLTRRSSPGALALAAEIENADSRVRALLLRMIRLLPRLDDRALALLVRNIEALEEDADATANRPAVRGED